jgi:hypothetical protein
VPAAFHNWPVKGTPGILALSGCPISDIMTN